MIMLVFDDFCQRRGSGYTGSNAQEEINGDTKALAMFESIRAHGAVRMVLHSKTCRGFSANIPKVPCGTKNRLRSHPAASLSSLDIDLLYGPVHGKLHPHDGPAAVCHRHRCRHPGTLVTYPQQR